MPIAQAFFEEGTDPFSERPESERNRRTESRNRTMNLPLKS